MPYRTSGAELCTVCNSFTSGERCPRCGRALCCEHVPPATRRCSDCEAEYEQWAELVRSMPLAVLAFRVGLVAKSCVLLILVGQLDAFGQIGPFLSLAGATMALIFVASLGVIWVRRRSLRDRFLAQLRQSPGAARRPRPAPVRLPSLPRTAPMLVRW